MQDKVSLLVRRSRQRLIAVLPLQSDSSFRSYLSNMTHLMRHYARIHQSLIALTFFIILNNILVVQAASQVPELPMDVIVSDPYQFADTVRLLSDYTSGIDEDPDAIAQTLESRINGEFLSTNPLLASQPSQSDEPTPQPSSEVAERAKEVKYTVQIGDTLSGIGSKFDLKLATIKVKNNISDVDSLKPGQELTIPVDDLSDKAIKAAQDRQQASKQLAQQQTTKNRIVATAKAGGYGLAVPIRHNGISRGLISGVHTGIDYRANTGTSVLAAQEGVVAVADSGGWNGGYGKYIVVSHGNGRTTYYAHLNSVQVRQGQRVSQGEVIGLSGNTGRSTGPHLHFELRINGQAVNPF